jgi:hypothetical protein
MQGEEVERKWQNKNTNSKTWNNDLHVYKEISLEGMSVLEHAAVKGLTDRLDYSIFMENIDNCKAYQENPSLGYQRLY